MNDFAVASASHTLPDLDKDRMALNIYALVNEGRIEMDRKNEKAARIRFEQAGKYLSELWGKLDG